MSSLQVIFLFIVKKYLRKALIPLIGVRLLSEDDYNKNMLLFFHRRTCGKGVAKCILSS